MVWKSAPLFSATFWVIHTYASSYCLLYLCLFSYALPPPCSELFCLLIIITATSPPSSPRNLLQLLPPHLSSAKPFFCITVVTACGQDPRLDSAEACGSPAIDFSQARFSLKGFDDFPLALLWGKEDMRANQLLHWIHQRPAVADEWNSIKMWLWNQAYILAHFL